MDIFNTPKRTKDDSIKKPFNYPQAQTTQQKLKDDQQNQLNLLNNFLTNLSVKFDYKINNCSLKCISTAQSYKQVSQCEQKCSEGVMKFDKYVSSRLSEMQQLLGDCVSNANSLHNPMDQIYFCYELYNNGFKKVKQFIAEESMFYQ